MLAVVPVVSEDARKQALQDGKEYGHSLQGEMHDAVQQPALHEQVPAYEGTDVPEVDYRGMGLGIEDAARLRLRESAPGMHVYDSALGRPQFNLDQQQDPVLRRGREIGTRPEGVISGMQGEYSGCVQTPASAGTATYTERCTAWQARIRDCEQELTPRCTTRGACTQDGGALQLLQASHGDVVWEYRYPMLTVGNPSGGAWKGGGYCSARGGPTLYTRSFRFDVQDPGRLEEFRLVRVHYEDHLSVLLNGQAVYGPQSLRFGSRQSCRLIHPFFSCGRDQSQGEVCQARDGGPCRPFFACDCYKRCCSTYWGVNGGSNNCEVGERQDEPGIDLLPYLQAGENVLEMKVMVADTGGAWLQLSARQNCCTSWQDTWSACTAEADADCAHAPGAVHCLDEGGEREVEGERIQRDCWSRKMRYTCLGGDTYTEEAYCSELRARGCAQIGSDCVDTGPGEVCTEYEQRYQCTESETTAGTQLHCDDRLYCLGDDCFETGYEASADFPLAASHLGALEEAVRDMDPHSLNIFSGTVRKCKKTVLGFSNCCRDSGWGVSLGIAGCSASERALGQQRAAGQCHYVGSYKTGSLFSKKRYQSFCCFNSKLGRMVQQQGRVQLGIDWGGARRPQCRGYTPQELGALDFERIDFTEFYGDALKEAGQVVRPEAGTLGRRLEERLRTRLAQ